jgi:hypothetical protein
MANTTNFGWETPDDTDLVKDGAAAIRTLGSAIDTSLVDLKGGTTGQVLSKATGTDMDFTWVTSDDANAIQNAIVDAKGDIVAASAADTPARLAVGTDNQRLVAASGEATGLKYVGDTQNTVIDVEGDLLVGDAADALQRLAIGSNAQVLTVDTTVDGKIKWAAPAGGGGFVGCALTKSASQTISNNTGTFISFNGEDFDTDGFHDNSTNNTRITIPAGKGGKYQVNFNLQWAANTAGTRYCMLAKNGTNVVEKLLSVSTTGGYAEQFLGIILDLSVADYIEAKVDQSSGGSLDVWGDNNLARGTSLSVTYLGA